jgi:hypothetical protein
MGQGTGWWISGARAPSLCYVCTADVLVYISGGVVMRSGSVRRRLVLSSLVLLQAVGAGSAQTCTKITKIQRGAWGCVLPCGKW